MNKIISRRLASDIQRRLKNTPAVAILGPRQCGKSTLAKELLRSRPDSIYIDLERHSDRRKLDEPELFFNATRDNLVCLDEIQRVPELFATMRSVIDDRSRDGQFLILGSASRDLLRQSSETLAGRIAYVELTPLTLDEALTDKTNGSFEEQLRRIWLRGGFPRSFLASDELSSFEWRTDFIRTFLERDIPNLGFSLSTVTLERLWRMLAHSQGQLLNSSKLGDSLGVSNHTVRKYIDILEQTFTVRTLTPFEANVKKRLVKSPKVYIRDSGVVHALLDVENFNDLLGHPVLGSSWEGWAIETITAALPRWRSFFYRRSDGVEIDLILSKGQRRVAVEFKASIAPKLTKGFFKAVDDLNIEERWLIAPVTDAYPISGDVTVSSPVGLTQALNDSRLI